MNPTLLPNTDSATADPNSSASDTAPAGSGKSQGPSAPASSSGAGAGDRKDSEAKRARRERNAAENKKNANEVRLALWPTPETAKSVCQQSGESAIDYVRLFGSITFRARWQDFKKKTKPSSNDVVQLRKLAIEILGKRKGKPHRHSGNKKDPEKKGESTVPKRSGGKDTDYEKRKRDSSSSSAESGAKKQPFKIPKVGSSGASAATLPPEDTMDTGSADGDGIVEDEGDYAPLEQFTHDIEGALPTGDYAKAAQSKKRKIDYPFLLYVHKGKSLREKIPKQAWTLFKEKFNEILVEATLEDKATPDIDWTGYKSGTGVVATTDAWSRDAAKEIIDSIEVAELQFTAYPKGVRDERKTVTLKLPSEFKNIDATKLCSAIEKKNKLQESGLWDFYTCRHIGEGGERIMRVVVDDKTVDTIREKLEGKVKIASRQLEVFLAGKRLG